MMKRRIKWDQILPILQQQTGSKQRKVSMKFPSTTVAANSSSTSTIANSSKYHNNKSQMKKGTDTYKTKSTSTTTVAESSPLGATNQLRVEEQRKAVEVVSLSEKIQKR